MSDLQALFAQDPLTYTKDKDELGQIIREFRSNRQRFLAGNVSAGKTKAPTAKQKKIDDLADKIGFGGLDLKL